MRGKTQTRLLEAAERVLVEQGVQALSVRRVGEVSGINPTLITYHFGSMAALLEELCARNLAPIQKAWERLADPLEPGADPLGQLLARWLEPLMAPAAFHPDSRALIVIDEIAAHGNNALSEMLVRDMTRIAFRVGDALAPHCPHLSREELRERLRLIAGAALGPPPRARLSDRSGGGAQREAAAAALVRFARAALSAP